MHQRLENSRYILNIICFQFSEIYISLMPFNIINYMHALIKDCRIPNFFTLSVGHVQRTQYLYSFQFIYACNKDWNILDLCYSLYLPRPESPSRCCRPGLYSVAEDYGIPPAAVNWLVPDSCPGLHCRNPGCRAFQSMLL